MYVYGWIFLIFKIFVQKISSVAGLQQAYNKRKARKNGQASLSFSLVPTIEECERVICILLCLFLVFNNNIVYHIYILFVSARLVWQFSGKTEKSFCSVYQTAVERAKSRHVVLRYNQSLYRSRSIYSDRSYNRLSIMVSPVWHFQFREGSQEVLQCGHWVLVWWHTSFLCKNKWWGQNS